MARKRGKRWIAEGYDRTTRRKRYLGTRDTKKEAEQVEAKWKLRTTATGRETCDQFAERWTRDYPRPRKSTNLRNWRQVQKFAKDFKGIKLADVDRPTARAWALQNPSCVTVVRTMFADAERDEIIDRNPFAKLRLPGSRGRKDIVALTERELQELADNALHEDMQLGDFGPQFRAMVLFAGYVGLRPGELFALRREDLWGEFVTIERAFSSLSKEVRQPKNGKSRTVIVPPVAQEALLDVPPHDTWLFLSPAGRMWTQANHHRYWARLCRLAGREGMDFYELRHACATMMLERGATVADVAHQLGHTDGGILVATVYGHPADAGARARNLALWGQADGPRALEVVRERRRPELFGSNSGETAV